MALTKQNVAELYVALFERVPEKEGFDAWYNAAIENDWGLGELAQSMLTAAQQVVSADEGFAEVYPQYVNVDQTNEESVRDIIESVYQTLFNKTYADDPEGIDTWVDNVVVDGENLGNVVASITTIANQLADAPTLDEDTKKAVDTYQNKVDIALYGAEEIDSADVDKDGTVDPEDLKELQEPLKLVNDTEESVEAAKEKVEELAKSVFDLTPGDDIIVGTEKDDIFNATVSISSDEKTLSSADQIDGSDGVDTLNVNLTTSFSGFTTGGVTNVENIVLTNESTIARSFSAEGVEGAESYIINADTKEISNLTDLEKAVDITINNQDSGSFTATFADDAAEVAGTEDAMKLTLNNVGTAATDTEDQEAVEINLEDIEEVNLVSNGTTNIVEFDGDDLKTLNVTGDSSLTLASVPESLENVSASALKGDFNADLSKVENLTTLETGEGNDTVTISANSTATDMILAGGTGEDVITLTSDAEKTVAYKMSDFETLEIGKTTGELTFIGTEVADLEKVVISEEVGNTVKLYQMASADLTLEATNETQSQLVSTDNIGATVLNYSTENTEEAEESKASFEFLKAQDVTVNIGNNVKATGEIAAPTASVLALNVDAAGEFAGSFDASNVKDLNIKSEGGDVTATGDLNSLESLVVDSQGSVDLSAIDLKNIANVELKGGVESEVKLADLGYEDLEYGIKVSAENVAQGVALSNITSTEDISVTSTGSKVIGDTTKTIKSIEGDVEVDIKDSNESVVLNAIDASAGKADVTVKTLQAATLGDITAVNTTVEVEASQDNVTMGNVTATEKADITVSTYKSITVGDVTANDAIINFSEVYGDTTVKSITVTDSLDFTGSGTQGTTLDGIAIAAEATDTVITLNSGVEADSFTIKTADYDNNAALTVKGDLGIGGDSITVDASVETDNDLVINLAGLDNVTTGTITGGAGNDTITTTSGNDTVDGGAGADKIYAGDGNDAITIDADDVVVDGGAGTDTVKFAASTTNDFTDEDDIFTDVEVIDMAGGDIKLTLTAQQFSSLTEVTGDDATKDILTIKGGDSADTIDLSVTTKVGAVVDGGKGADTIKLNTSVDGEKVINSSAFEAADTINDFTTGKDQLYLDFAIGGKDNKFGAINEIGTKLLNSSKLQLLKSDTKVGSGGVKLTATNTSKATAALSTKVFYTGKGIEFKGGDIKITGTGTKGTGTKTITKITKTKDEIGMFFYDVDDNKLMLLGISATKTTTKSKTASGTNTNTHTNINNLTSATVAIVGDSIAATDIFIF